MSSASTNTAGSKNPHLVTARCVVHVGQKNKPKLNAFHLLPMQQVVDMREKNNMRKFMPVDVACAKRPDTVVQKYNRFLRLDDPAVINSADSTTFDGFVSSVLEPARATYYRLVPQTFFFVADGIGRDLVILLRCLQFLLPIGDDAVPLDSLLQICRTGDTAQLFWCRSSLNHHTPLEAAVSGLIALRQQQQKKQTKTDDDTDSTNMADAFSQVAEALVRRGAPLYRLDERESVTTGGPIHMLLSAGDIDEAAKLMSAAADAGHLGADCSSAANITSPVELVFGNLVGAVRTRRFEPGASVNSVRDIPSLQLRCRGLWALFDKTACPDEALLARAALLSFRARTRSYALSVADLSAAADADPKRMAQLLEIFHSPEHRPDCSTGLLLHHLLAQRSMSTEEESEGEGEESKLVAALAALPDNSPVLSQFNASGRNALHTAIACGRVGVVQKLLEKNKSLAVVPTKPRTADVPFSADRFKSLSPSGHGQKQRYQYGRVDRFTGTASAGDDQLTVSHKPFLLQDSTKLPLECALLDLRKPDAAAEIALLLLNNMNSFASDAKAKARLFGPSAAGTHGLASYRIDTLLATAIERSSSSSSSSSSCSSSSSSSSTNKKHQQKMNNAMQAVVDELLKLFIVCVRQQELVSTTADGANIPSKSIIAAINTGSKDFLRVLASSSPTNLGFKLGECVLNLQDYSLVPFEARHRDCFSLGADANMLGNWLGQDGRGSLYDTKDERLQKQPRLVEFGRRILTPILYAALQNNAAMVEFLVSDLGCSSTAPAAVFETLRAQDKKRIESLKEYHSKQQQQQRSKQETVGMKQVQEQEDVHLLAWDKETVSGAQHHCAAEALSYLCRFLRSHPFETFAVNRAPTKNSYLDAHERARASLAEGSATMKIFEVLLDGVVKATSSSSSSSSGHSLPLYWRVFALGLFLESILVAKRGGKLLLRVVSALQLDGAEAALEFAALERKPRRCSKNRRYRYTMKKKKDGDQEEEELAWPDELWLDKHAAAVVVAVHRGLLPHLLRLAQFGILFSGADGAGGQVQQLAPWLWWSFLAAHTERYNNHEAERSAFARAPRWAQTALAADGSARSGNFTSTAVMHGGSGIGGDAASHLRRQAFWKQVCDYLSSSSSSFPLDDHDHWIFIRTAAQLYSAGNTRHENSAFQQQLVALRESGRVLPRTIHPDGGHSGNSIDASDSKGTFLYRLVVARAADTVELARLIPTLQLGGKKDSVANVEKKQLECAERDGANRSCYFKPLGKEEARELSGITREIFAADDALRRTGVSSGESAAQLAQRRKQALEEAFFPPTGSCSRRSRFSYALSSFCHDAGFCSALEAEQVLTAHTEPVTLLSAEVEEPAAVLQQEIDVLVKYQRVILCSAAIQHATGLAGTEEEGKDRSALRAKYLATVLRYADDFISVASSFDMCRLAAVSPALFEKVFVQQRLFDKMSRLEQRFPNDPPANFEAKPRPETAAPFTPERLISYYYALAGEKTGRFIDNAENLHVIKRRNALLEMVASRAVGAGTRRSRTSSSSSSNNWFEEMLITSMKHYISNFIENASSGNEPARDDKKETRPDFLFERQHFAIYPFEQLLLCLQLAAVTSNENNDTTDSGASKFCLWLLSDDCFECIKNMYHEFNDRNAELAKKEDLDGVPKEASRFRAPFEPAAFLDGMKDDPRDGVQAHLYTYTATLESPFVFLFHVVYRVAAQTQSLSLLHRLAEVRRRGSISDSEFQFKSPFLRAQFVEDRMMRRRSLMDFSDTFWNYHTGVHSPAQPTGVLRGHDEEDDDEEEEEEEESDSALSHELCLSDDAWDKATEKEIIWQEQNQPPLQLVFYSQSARFRGGAVAVMDEAVAVRGTAFEHLVRDTLWRPKMLVLRGMCLYTGSDMTQRARNMYGWRQQQRRAVDDLTCRYDRGFLSQQELVRLYLQKANNNNLEEEVFTFWPMMRDTELLWRLSRLEKEIRVESSSSGEAQQRRHRVLSLFESILRGALRSATERGLLTPRRQSTRTHFAVMNPVNDNGNFFFPSAVVGSFQSCANIHLFRNTQHINFAYSLLYLLSGASGLDTVGALRLKASDYPLDCSTLREPEHWYNLPPGRHGELERLWNRGEVPQPAVAPEFCLRALRLLEHVCANHPSTMAIDTAKTLLPPLRERFNFSTRDVNDCKVQFRPQCYIPSNFWTFAGPHHQNLFGQQLLFDFNEGAESSQLPRLCDGDSGVLCNAYDLLLPPHDEQLLFKVAESVQRRVEREAAEKEKEGQFVDVDLKFRLELQRLAVERFGYSKTEEGDLGDFDDAFQWNHTGVADTLLSTPMIEGAAAPADLDAGAPLLSDEAVRCKARTLFALSLRELRQHEPGLRMLASAVVNSSKTAAAVELSFEDLFDDANTASLSFSSTAAVRDFIIASNMRPESAAWASVTVDDDLASHPILQRSLAAAASIVAPPQLTQLHEELPWMYLMECGFSKETAQAIDYLGEMRLEFRLMAEQQKQQLLEAAAQSTAISPRAHTIVELSADERSFVVSVDVVSSLGQQQQQQQQQQQKENGEQPLAQDFAVLPVDSPFARAVSYANSPKLFEYYVRRDQLKPWLDFEPLASPLALRDAVCLAGRRCEPAVINWIIDGCCARRGPAAYDNTHQLLRKAGNIEKKQREMERAKLRKELEENWDQGIPRKFDKQTTIERQLPPRVHSWESPNPLTECLAGHHHLCDATFRWFFSPVVRNRNCPCQFFGDAEQMGEKLLRAFVETAPAEANEEEGANGSRARLLLWAFRRSRVAPTGWYDVPNFLPGQDQFESSDKCDVVVNIARGQGNLELARTLQVVHVMSTLERDYKEDAEDDGCSE